MQTKYALDGGTAPVWHDSKHKNTLYCVLGLDVVALRLQVR